MDISIKDAKARLTEIVRRAEAGEPVFITRHGRAVVRVEPIASAPSPADKRQCIDFVRRKAAEAIKPGRSSAEIQDDLYDPETGLPV